jgi:hypothetical protein
MFDLGLLHDIGVSSTRTHQHLVSEFDWAGSQQHCIMAPACWQALPRWPPWWSRCATTTRHGKPCRA